MFRFLPNFCRTSTNRLIIHENFWNAQSRHTFRYGLPKNYKKMSGSTSRKRAVDDETILGPNKKLKDNHQDTLHNYITLKSCAEFVFEDIVNRKDNKDFLNQHVLFENKITKFGTPPEVEDMEQHNRYRMVLRKEALTLFDHIDQYHNDFKNGVINRMGKALWGAGGVGKSSLLFLATQYCNAKGWIVIYIPTAPLPTLPWSRWCDDLLSTIEDYYGEEIIREETVKNACRTSEPGPDTLLDVVYKLGSKASKPVLIAVDQWNVMIREGSDASNSFTRFFSNFENVGTLKKAIFLCALSSQATSTLPSTAFRDANLQATKLRIDPYDNEAFNSHLGVMQTLGVLPKLTITQIETIRYETASIPRLVTWIAKDGLNIDEFSTKAIDYYSKRIGSFLARNANNKETAHIAASIYLNKVVKGPVDHIWIDQGILLAQGSDIYDAPCPSARKAIYSVMKTMNINYFKLLLSDKALRGRALELLFLQSFTQTDGKNPLLKSIKLDDSTHLTISVKSIFYQSAPTKQVYDVFTIEKGTLVVCHDYHAVIDFVFRTLEDTLILVQVSNTDYARHDPPTETVFEKKGTKDSEQMTLYNFYRICSGKSEVAETARIHSATFVLYLTPSPVNTRGVRGISILKEKEQWSQIVGDEKADLIFNK